jgi:hypothetical protein
MDTMLTEWSLYDIGAYPQRLMHAAVQKGLSTIPAITLMLYRTSCGGSFQFPTSLKLTIGIAIGYADNANRINNFASARGPDRRDGPVPGLTAARVFRSNRGSPAQ